MSWITNINAKPDPNFKDDGPKVPDPAIPDRMVSTKRANQPFLKCVLSFGVVTPTPPYSHTFANKGTRPTATNRPNYTPTGAHAKTRA